MPNCFASYLVSMLVPHLLLLLVLLDTRVQYFSNFVHYYILICKDQKGKAFCFGVFTLPCRW